MFVRFAAWIMQIIELIFFIGLMGCAFVVILSWISIVKEGFSRKDQISAARDNNFATAYMQTAGGPATKRSDVAFGEAG